MGKNDKVRERRRALVLALVALLLAGLACSGSCPEGCSTSIECVHSVTGDRKTVTKAGCSARCPFLYEYVLGSRVVSCPEGSE